MWWSRAPVLDRQQLISEPEQPATFSDANFERMKSIKSNQHYVEAMEKEQNRVHVKIYVKSK